MVITGNKGFIGGNLTSLTGWGGFDIECDIRDYDQVSERIKGHDTVVHLAALAGVQQSLKSSAEYYKTNVLGTLNIVRACYKNKARLIFASSSSVYENLSPYAKTKSECEEIIQDFMILGLNACVLRFFTVFGENNRKDMAVYKFTQAIRNGEQIHLYGDCQRDFTYVQDLCKGIKAVAESDIKGVYDFGFGEPVKVSKVVNILEGIIGKKARIIEEPQRRFDPIETKSKPFLEQFTTKTPLKEALINTVKTI